MSGRRYLSQRDYDALLLEQDGKCCVEECDSAGPFIGEHTTPNYYKPGKPDALMCVECHKVKTRADKRDIYKTKRLDGEVLSQYEKRKRFGPALRSRNSFEDRRRP